MISSSERDSCSQLVAGNYDVIINDQPASMKSIMTDFLDRFQQHESELSPNSQDCSYANEFKLLKEFSRVLKEDKANLQFGEQEVNLKKNRYKDILPFSHTRVILSDNPDQPGSCYINANYIRGPSGSPKAYIACQGPLACTLDDFWRMIWECNVSVIVMACNEHESGQSKCELYWPENIDSTQIYGNIQVTLLRVRQICPDFLIRKFSVKFTPPQSKDYKESSPTTDSNHKMSQDLSGNNNDINSQDNYRPSNGVGKTEDCDNTQRKNSPVLERTVCQFHYTTWPDHGVPDSVHPILELVRLIRDVQPAEDRPILVHCSAGCGRTGTICCIDYVWGLLRRSKLDANFDLCNIISEMRQQRMAMVQTLEQYILCHRTVAALFIQHLKLMESEAYHNLDTINVDDETDKVFDEPEDIGPVFI